MDRKKIALIGIFLLLFTSIIYANMVHGAYGTSKARFCVGEGCIYVPFNFTDYIQIRVEEECIYVYYREIKSATYWIEIMHDCVY